MYTTNGLKHYVNIHNENLADAESVPQNTTFNGTPVKLDGALGSTEVVVRTHTAINVANAKTITVKLQHAAADLSYSDLATVYSLTAAGGNGAIAKNVELGRYALPSNVKANLRVVITTDDAAATGKLDVIPTYLPR